MGNMRIVLTSSGSLQKHARTHSGGVLQAGRSSLLSAKQDGSNSELKYASHLIRYNAIVVYRWIFTKW